RRACARLVHKSRQAREGDARPQELFRRPRQGVRRPQHFPYTTLFRSYPLDSGGRSYGSSCSAPISTIRPAKPALRSSSAARAPEDRKSTRLNSSHRTISYAVFCLKKTTTSTSRPARRG